MTRRRIDPKNPPPVFLTVTPEARSAFGAALLSGERVRPSGTAAGATVAGEFIVSSIDGRGFVSLHQVSTVRGGT